MESTTITTNGSCADIKENHKKQDKEHSRKLTGKEKDMQEIEYNTSKGTH